MKVLIPADQIQRRVADLAVQIAQDYRDQSVTIVGVLTGSLIFLADLIRHLDLHLRIGLIQASSYRGETTTAGELTISPELLPDLRGRHVLLLDDILDTGQTLSRLVEHLQALRLESLRTGVLLRKQGRQQVVFEPNYVGFDIPDEFVVGYGLDYNDEYRHLPYIAVLKQRVSKDGPMKILHVIPNLDFTGAAAQLGLLAKHGTDPSRLLVCCLGAEGVWAPRLRKLGARVECLGGKGAFDIRMMWRLRRLMVTDAPEVVHAWSLQSLRAVGLVGRRWLGRTVVSRALSVGKRKASAVDGWLVRRARRVVASSRAEASLCRAAGVADHRLSIVPPGVEPVAAGAPQTGSHDEPRPQILCIGAQEAALGFRTAIWAYDSLRYLFPAIRLSMVGDGPERAYLEWFAGRLRTLDQVNFLGRRDDAPQLLTQADVCWAPARAGRGTQVVLEAMAAGCPVIAGDQPGLEEIIADESVGSRVPTGDAIAFCRATRRLLLEPERRREIGHAARAYVQKHFSPQVCAQAWLDCYRAA